MSLRRSPLVSPRMLAANRANAQKSTGPRTLRGKAQLTHNALKHGRYAARLFRSHLLQPHEDVALYDWMYKQICYHFQPVGKQQWAEAEKTAREVWCSFRQGRKEGLREGHKPPRSCSVWSNMRVPLSLGGRVRTNRIYAVKSTEHFVTFPTRFRLRVPKTGIRLQFWVWRRRRIFPPAPRRAYPRFEPRLPAKRGWRMPANGTGALRTPTPPLDRPLLPDLAGRVCVENRRRDRVATVRRRRKALGENRWIRRVEDSASCFRRLWP